MKSVLIATLSAALTTIEIATLIPQVGQDRRMPGRVKQCVKHFLLPMSAIRQFDRRRVLNRDMALLAEDARMTGKRSRAQDRMARAVEET